MLCYDINKIILNVTYFDLMKTAELMQCQYGHGTENVLLTRISQTTLPYKREVIQGP